ncbi:MAG TPA: transglycosylase SLT domain-containing protein [Terriglobales bacterium]|nr:transglycosylase SLT domain-containing protein [Terriglobales bacterium]
MTLRTWFLLLLLTVPAGAPLYPQSTGKAPSKPQAAAKKPAAKKPASKKVWKKRKPSRAQMSAAARVALARRARRMKRAFVASAELKPMAQQLLENRTASAYSGVESWARKHAATEEGALAWLVVGYAHFLDHDFESSIAALKRAQTHAGELGDYAAWFLGNSYAAGGKPEQAIATLAEFGKNYPDSIFARDAAILTANSLVATGKPREALAVLAPYRVPFRAEVELAVGRAYIKSGETAKGAEALRRLYYTAPASPLADAAGADLQSLPADLPPPAFADRQKRADLLLEARRYADAAREYRQLLAGTEPGNLTRLQLNLAIALYKAGNRSDARQLFESLPDQPADASARRYFYLGEIARSEGDEDRMQRMIAKLREMAPNDPVLADALLSAGNMYLLKKDYESAARAYREIYERFPNGRSSAYAHWKTAWLTFRNGRTDEARALLDEHLRNYPASAEAAPALYWRGRVAEEQGDLPFARACYSTLSDRFRMYYYADLARDRLKEIKLDPVAQPVAFQGISERPAPRGDVEPPADNVRVARSLVLRNAALFDYAVKELQAAAGEDDNTAWVAREIARVYEDAGRYDRALQTLKRAVPSYFAVEIAALPRPYWEALFPRPWWTDFKRYSTDNQLDPFLVASLVRQESEFNPAAISHANAFGLMQILPSVGKKLAKEVKLRNFSTDLLLMPQINLQLGTRYFRGLLDKYDGKVEYALAAYNAGTDRVEDWSASGKYRDTAEFVENIPFTETREYVQAIMRNVHVYRRLYGTP